MSVPKQIKSMGLIKDIVSDIGGSLRQNEILGKSMNLFGDNMSSIIGSLPIEAANVGKSYLNYYMQDRLAQKQMDFQEKMWQKNADWNSIGNQVDRLKAAGLNPAAILSNGNPSSPSQALGSPGLPKVQSHLQPTIDGLAMRKMTADTTKAEADARLAMKNASALESEVAQRYSEIERNAALSTFYHSQNISERLKAEAMEIQNRYLEDFYDLQNKGLQSNIDKNYAMLDKFLADTEQTLYNLHVKSPAEVQAIYTAIEKSYVEMVSMQVVQELNIAQTELTAQRVLQIQEDVRHAMRMNGITEKYEGARQVMGLVNDGVDAIGGLVGSVTGVTAVFDNIKKLRSPELRNKVVKQSVERYNSDGVHVGTTHTSRYENAY